MKSKHWSPERYPIPEEKELQIKYDPETDVLTLWNGTPAGNGSSIARHLMVFFDECDDAQLVTLEHASELLGPIFEKARSLGSGQSATL